jgi:hypothetical protein
MNWLRQHFAKLLKNSVSSPRRAVRPGRVRPGIEFLEDRVVPSLSPPLLSPDSHWIATVEGAPGVEVVQVTESGSGRVAYQSGAYTAIDHLTWSPNSLELAWVNQSPGGNWSYDWAGVLLTPTGVPPYQTEPSAPKFSADSSQLTYDLPGNPASVTFAAPTTPPTINITGVPNPVTAGSSFNATLSATPDDFYDARDIPLNLSSADRQPVPLTSPVLMHNGYAFAQIHLDQADTLAIQAGDGYWLTGSSAPFTVSPANISSFVLSTPSTATVRVPFKVILAAKDQFGNTAN